MPADKKVIGARLRAGREATPYWSRGRLAELLRAAADPRELPGLAHIPSLRQMIKAWEAGKYVPDHRYRKLYARVLGKSEEELFDPDSGDRPPSLWRPASTDLNGEVDPTGEERLVQAIAQPRRVDPAVVELLASILADQRRLDDSAGPAAVLPTTKIQAATAVHLLRGARGPIRQTLAPVTAEWVQFQGWLHAEMVDVGPAMRLLTNAEELADEAEDGTLAAQAANFKGYLARRRGTPRGIVRHFLTAYHTPGAHPAQRLGDAVQAAHGHAILGDAGAARRLLDEASALTDRAARELPPGTAYWLTPDFHNLNIGLALLALGEHNAAAEHLAFGLNTLPVDQQEAEWTREYRNALCRAQEHSG